MFVVCQQTNTFRSRDVHLLQMVVDAHTHMGSVRVLRCGVCTILYMLCPLVLHKKSHCVSHTVAVMFNHLERVEAIDFLIVRLEFLRVLMPYRFCPQRLLIFGMAST